MSVPTVAQQRTRIEALCALLPTVTPLVFVRVVTGSNCGIADGTFPAVEVRARGARRERISTGTLLKVTRDWELWLFVSEVCDPTDVDEQRTAIEACDPYLESVPDFFEARTRLEDEDDNGIAYGTTVMQDTGAVLTPYGVRVYSMVRYIFSTILVKSVSI